MTVFCVFPLQVGKTIIKNWNSQLVNNPLTASVNATSSTVCVAVGCYEVDSREPYTALTNMMSCSYVVEGKKPCIFIYFCGQAA